MKTTSKLTLELTRNCSSPIICAVQEDRYSRELELTLLENGDAWIIPEDASVLIRYSKSDGKGGEYNTLPDERPAWTISENILTLSLAPQVLTTPGTVRLAVILMRGDVQLSTVTMILSVQAAVHAMAGESEDYFHVPGFLPAPASAETGQYLQVSSVDSAGHVTGLRAASLEAKNRETVEPGDDDIPKVFFGAALPQTKSDTIMPFRYISKTADISGYCKTKAQGNSSMGFPKKNQTVKLYRDAGCTEKLKVDFKGWGAQNKFCFKANWIDLTHARNIVSARLWGDVVKSRASYDTIPELLRTSPNQGAVDGFPVKVYAGGIYQGRYTLNIPKDAWMANMDDELDTHCILCGENYGSGCFRAEASIDGSDWTDEVHDAVPDSIKTRWNEAIRFVRNSTDAEFAAGIGNYFDVDSLIDYYIFGVLICNRDGFGKNQLYMTYDGLKWYATVYDLDCTFGTYFGTVLDFDHARIEFEDFKISGTDPRYGNLLYLRIEALFIEQIQDRYRELRGGALSLDNIINRFEQFTDIAPPHLVAEDYAETTADGAFTAIPLQDRSNIQQIRNFIAARYTYVANFIGALGNAHNLLYYLPAETTFDGVDDYIDTGLALMNEARSFTIFADFTDDGTSAPNSKVFSCVQDHGGGSYGGLQLMRYAYGNGYFISGCPGNAEQYLWSSPINLSGHIRIAIRFENGVPDGLCFVSDGQSCKQGDVWYGIDSVKEKYPFIHSRNILLGCREYGSGYENKGNYWSGTIHAFEVWDYAMSDDELFQKVT